MGKKLGSSHTACTTSGSWTCYVFLSCHGELFQGAHIARHNARAVLVYGSSRTHSLCVSCRTGNSSTRVMFAYKLPLVQSKPTPSKSCILRSAAQATSAPHPSSANTASPLRAARTRNPAPAPPPAPPTGLAPTAAAPRRRSQRSAPTTSAWPAARASAGPSGGPGPGRSAARRPCSSGAAGCSPSWRRRPSCSGPG